MAASILSILVQDDLARLWSGNGVRSGYGKRVTDTTSIFLGRRSSRASA